MKIKLQYILCFLYTSFSFAQSGIFDTSFNVGTGTSSIFANAIQTDEKIVIGGGFTNFNGIEQNRIARLNSDGSLDTSFITGQGFNNLVRAIAIQADGKIIAGGNFGIYNNQYVGRIARLNTDGSLDATFIASSFNGDITSIVIQSDAKILVGGNFTSYGTRNRMVRLNSDGSIDSSFNIGNGFNEVVHVIVIEDDGKILVGGYFSQFNGTPINSLVRLNTDGSFDSTFNIGVGFNNIVRSIVVQPDGKIICTGNFTTFNTLATNRIVRLQSDGNLDTSFVSGTGANSEVKCSLIQYDGKILIGGDFTSYNGATINRFTQLNHNGSLDTNFNVDGIGASASVYNIAIQTVGKLIISGIFSYYNEVSSQGIARIIGNSTLGVEKAAMKSVKYYPNPTKDIIHIESASTINTVKVTNLIGQQVAFYKVTNTRFDLNLIDLKSGIYYISIASDKLNQNFKVVKE